MTIKSDAPRAAMRAQEETCLLGLPESGAAGAYAIPVDTAGMTTLHMLKRMSDHRRLAQKNSLRMNDVVWVDSPAK